MSNKRLLPLLLSLLLATGLWAQPALSPDVPTMKGYQVKVKNIDSHYKKIAGAKNLCPGKLYLIGWCGAESYLLDSAVVRKGKALFKNKAEVPCGVYGMFNDNMIGLGDIILNHNNKFTFDLADNHVEGSEENQQLQQFRLKAKNVPVENLCREMTETMPQSFLSKFVTVTYGANALAIDNPSLHDLLTRHLNATDLQEPRLLFSHVPVFRMIGDDIEVAVFPNSDSVIRHIRYLLDRPMCQPVRNYIIRTLFSRLDVHNPDYDPALVYLYDQYDHSWIDEGDARRYKRKIDNLRKVIPGAQIPELISHDIDGKAHSTLDIKTHYTVLWFWDPDCDHCQEMTPILHKMYQENAKNYDFEVFAVEVNDDYERWKAFSDKHQLWDWTNLSTSRGEQNLDFIEYFDIMTTPVMFLIDNTQNHTIIARQITLDELRSFFNSKK